MRLSDVDAASPSSPDGPTAPSYDSAANHAGNGPTKSARRSRACDSGLFARVGELCAGYSIAQVARMTRTNAETARRYLAGITPPSVEFLQRLGDATGCSASWLLFGRGGRSESPEPARRLCEVGTDELVSELRVRLSQIDLDALRARYSPGVESPAHTNPPARSFCPRC